MRYHGVAEAMPPPTLLREEFGGSPLPTKGDVGTKSKHPLAFTHSQPQDPHCRRCQQRRAF